VALAYGALGVYPDEAQADGPHLYAVQWINPSPGDAIKRVTLKVFDAPARPMLVGLAIQKPSE
jgi:hypothetical protein